MNCVQKRPRIYTLPAKTVVLCCTIFILSFSENGFCQEDHSSFEESPFLLAINRPEGHPAYTYLNMLYTEIFRRLEIPFKLIYLPLKRGAFEMDSGRYDGETSRIYTYGDDHPDLIRVQEYLYRTDVSAYATDPTIASLNGWQSLDGTQYKVEYPRGVVLSGIKLKKVVEPKNLSSIVTAEQGLRRLLLNRTDIYIDDDLVVKPLLKESEEFDNATVYKLGPMESVALYMYIHQKNRALEPRLSRVIKEVRDEGLMERYRKVVFGF